MHKNDFCYSLPSPLRICLFFSLSSGDCSKTLESLIRMKICFIAQESQQYSSLDEMLTVQTQLSMLPSTLFSPYRSPMCYAYVSTFLAALYINSVPRLPRWEIPYNPHRTSSYLLHLQLAPFSSQLLCVFSLLTPSLPNTSCTGVLTLRSWHRDCHCGKKSTALTSQCLGFSPGWSCKKSVPWTLNCFGISERNTLPMDLSLVLWTSA